MTGIITETFPKKPYRKPPLFLLAWMAFLLAFSLADTLEYADDIDGLARAGGMRSGLYFVEPEIDDGDDFDGSGSRRISAWYLSESDMKVAYPAAVTPAGVSGTGVSSGADDYGCRKVVKIRDQLDDGDGSGAGYALWDVESDGFDYVANIREKYSYPVFYPFEEKMNIDGEIVVIYIMITGCQL